VVPGEEEVCLALVPEASPVAGEPVPAEQVLVERVVVRRAQAYGNQVVHREAEALAREPALVVPGREPAAEEQAEELALARGKVAAPAGPVLVVEDSATAEGQEPE
jgi:hypothetical protein